jgi:hypothetical protein
MKDGKPPVHTVSYLFRSRKSYHPPVAPDHGYDGIREMRHEKSNEGIVACCDAVSHGVSEQSAGFDRNNDCSATPGPGGSRSARKARS